MFSCVFLPVQWHVDKSEEAYKGLLICIAITACELELHNSCYRLPSVSNQHKAVIIFHIVNSL